MADLTPIFNVRKRIAIGIVGQSNEQGRALPAGLATYPQAFGSIRRPDKYGGGLMPGQIAVPANGTLSGLTRFTPYGSMWWKCFDDLYDWGYQAEFFNGAIGSTSLIEHWAGTVKTWTVNTQFYPKRAPIGGGDLGCIGDIIIKPALGADSRLYVWRCTGGKASFCVYDGNQPVAGLANKVDFFTAIGTGQSGSSEPNWASVDIGGTITDGTLVWTCERVNDVGFAAGNIGRQNMLGFYWDPYGLINRVFNALQAIDADEKFVIIENAQSDTGATQNAYRDAIQNIAAFFRDRGITVLIGLSCYTPTSTTTAYNTLQAARLAALTTFNGNGNVQAYGAKVQPGANLYATMGTTLTGKLETDNVHLNGAGDIEAGEDWGDAFKAFLPQRAA